MSDLDLDALLARKGPARVTRVEGLAPDVQEQRRAEVKNRDSLSRHYANRALQTLHVDDFKELLRQARAKIDTERGPLPGDPTTNGAQP